ncbi:MAG: hypothetical protein LUD72_11240 [Bacteroidales bacterium]|nr:hypothetical protein [Bacteroidales bacterium]
MTAKEYLGQLRQLDIKINQKLHELDELQEKAAAIGSLDYAKDRIQTSPPPEAPFSKTIEKIADMSIEINREVDAFVDLQREIIGKIQGLEDPRYIDVLYKRYVEYKNWRTIAEEMDYHEKHAYRLHGEAINVFEICYPMLP